MNTFAPTITAHLVVRGARAAQWYADAFGAVAERRLAVPTDGSWSSRCASATAADAG